MRPTLRYTFALLLTVVMLSNASVVAQTKPAGEKPARAELALDYSYVHSNAPPGGCGCINLNGGSATFAWPLKYGGLAVVGDITAVHAGAILAGGYSLTLSTYTAGGRYTPHLAHLPVKPFAQLLIGGGHSSGSLVVSTTPSSAGGAFAANFGAGADLHLTNRFSLRLVEANYMLTTFNNGTNNRQNNLRISTGLVVHF